jgi:hypothetical protein
MKSFGIITDALEGISVIEPENSIRSLRNEVGDYSIDLYENLEESKDVLSELTNDKVVGIDVDLEVRDTDQSVDVFKFREIDEPSINLDVTGHVSRDLGLSSIRFNGDPSINLDESVYAGNITEAVSVNLDPSLYHDEHENVSEEDQVKEEGNSLLFILEQDDVFYSFATEAYSMYPIGREDSESLATESIQIN